MHGTSSLHVAYHCVIFQPSLEVCGSCLVQVLTCGISLCDISTKLGGLWVMPGTSSQDVAYHCVIFQPSLEVCGSCLVYVLNTRHITV